MSKKLTKEEVRKPDAFIHYTDKAIAWIEAHGKSIAAIILVFSMGGAVYVGVNKYAKVQEQKAQAELYSLRVEMEKLNESFKEDDKKDDNSKAANSEKTDENKGEKQDENQKDFSTHYAKLIEAYKKFFVDFANTNSEKAGLIQLANLFVENKKWTEVINLLEQPVNTAPKESFYQGLMTMQLSQAQMNSDKCAEAIKVLESLSAQASHKHLHPESLLRIGLCYEQQENSEKAKQYFERVSRDFKDSEAATSAKNFLRYLTLKGSA